MPPEASAEALEQHPQEQGLSQKLQSILSVFRCVPRVRCILIPVKVRHEMVIHAHSGSRSCLAETAIRPDRRRSAGLFTAVPGRSMRHGLISDSRCLIMLPASPEHCRPLQHNSHAVRLTPQQQNRPDLVRFFLSLEFYTAATIMDAALCI